MSAYTSHIGAARAGGIRYILTDDLTWRIGHRDGPLYLVPAGFAFDVSVPLVFRPVFSPHDPAYHKAAAVHDHMLGAGWSRLTAAAEFYNALRADGVSAWRRWVMFLAVVAWTMR